MSMVHSGQGAVIPTEQTDKPVIASDETWPDTALAKTIYAHFTDFEGLNPEEAADSTGALLYSLQQIGVVGSMPEPGNGVRVADTATEDALRTEDWFHDRDMGAR